MITGYFDGQNWGKDFYYKGYFFKGNQFGEQVLSNFVDELKASMSDYNCLNEIIKDINGNFLIACKEANKTIIIADRIRSYPVFYLQFNNNVYISDDINYLLDKVGNREFDQCFMQEFLTSGFVSGSNTLYKEIKQIQAGEYIIFDDINNEICCYSHFDYTHTEQNNKSINELCEELDSVILRSFERFVYSVKGRPIAVFLSGGYDSRLVVTTLKRLNYENVICISFGYEHDKDVKCAKEIADCLGYQWILFRYDRKFWSNLEKEDWFWEYVRYCSNDSVIPYIQSIAIKFLIDKKSVSRDVVVVTGNSGDLLEGNHMSENFEASELYGRDQIIEELRQEHYYLMGLENSKRDWIFKVIEENCSFEKREYNGIEVQDILERYNWRERQSKFVISDVRTYDSLGIEWRLPLWDNEFIDFWLNVPYEFRNKRNLYYEYVRAERYPTANNISLARRGVNRLKNLCPRLVRKLYPYKKIVEYFYPYYSYSFYGLIDFGDYLRFIRMTRGERINVVSIIGYQLLRKSFGISEGKIKTLLNDSYRE